jgi:hypothetical protein
MPNRKEERSSKLRRLGRIAKRSQRGQMGTSEIIPTQVRQDDRWRSAIEWLGPPAKNSDEDDDDLVLPEAIVEEIAQITDIQTNMQPDFRDSLQTACRDASGRATFAHVIGVKRPTVLLNKIAETAHRLSHYLMQLEQTDYVKLDGAIFAILPRVLLRSRYSSLGQVEIDRYGSWTSLDLREYAGLTSGVATCADAVRGKLSLPEAGRRLGVALRFNHASYAEILKELPRGKAHHSSLVILVRDLRASIVYKAKGKLTLWRDPHSSEMRGTLPAVLTVLRPYLPDVIPNNISYRTLQRYCSLTAK